MLLGIKIHINHCHAMLEIPGHYKVSFWKEECYN